MSVVSPLFLAMNRIHNVIPDEVLALAFRPPFDHSFMTIPIDELINIRVIKARVIYDTNLVAGTVRDIVLMHDYLEPVDTTFDGIVGSGPFAVYRIPPEKRDNQQIVSVQSLRYPNGQFGAAYGYAGVYTGANLATYANAVLQSHTLSSTPVRPIPDVMPGNLIRLIPAQYSHINWILTCRLGYDEDFSRLNDAAIRNFTELCEHAVKSYIYTFLIVKLDKGYVSGGAEIGAIRECIAEYKESELRYQEMLGKFKSSATYDPMRMRAILKYIV